MLSTLAVRSVCVTAFDEARIVVNGLRWGEPEIISVDAEVLPDQDIAMSVKVVEDAFPHTEVRLNAHELRMVAIDRETGESFRLVHLDVHAQKIDARDLQPGKDVIERRGRR